jgi:two-component system, chemotaxis family, response regulator WspF
MRIAIVNDMPLAVQSLRAALALCPRHQLAWVAVDGLEAVTRCAHDTPDLVLMDLLMPGLDGVEATRRIMAATPCAILVVTGDVGARAGMVFEAMGAGALDAVDTPILAGPRRSAAVSDPLLRKIDRIELLLRERAPAGNGRPSAAQSARQLVAVGASAGGPAAMARLLGALPPTFDAAIVVVQHVDRQFAPGMAQWLAAGSPIPVRVVEEGQPPQAGTVQLAATNDHLVLDAGGRLVYQRAPADVAYRPSVDVFFRSVCRHWHGSAVGVLLTGMGRDGAQGLKALREQGHHTIAQDSDSCAVYGMPKAARELDAASEVLPPDAIAASLARRLHQGGLDHGRPDAADAAA